MKQSFACVRPVGAALLCSVRRAWSIGALSLLLGLSGTSASAATPIPFSADVEINADGFVRITGPVVAPLDESGRATLAQAVSKWRFLPAERNGRQVAATTTVFGEWTGPGRSDLRYLRHGPKVILSMPPRRPPGPNSLSLQTRTILEVSVAPDGTVAQTRIIAVASFPDQRDQALLMAAAAEASLRNWNFQPERIDGEAVSSVVIVPIGFRRRDGLPEQNWTIHLGKAEHFESEFWAQQPSVETSTPLFAQPPGFLGQMP